MAVDPGHRAGCNAVRLSGHVPVRDRTEPRSVIHGSSKQKNREVEFSALVEGNESAIFSYALRRVPNRDDAVDVVSETFLVAWRKIDQVPKGDNARLWLFGVARNQVANLNRGELRRRRLSERIRQELITACSRPVHEPSQGPQLLLEALSKLDPDDREILTLLAWDELKPAEVAEVMGLRRTTTRSRIHRARKRLKEQLDELQTAERPPAESGRTRIEEDHA